MFLDTSFSLVEKPSLSTLVESAMSNSTPCSPYSANLYKSITLSLIGFKSILKSPVCIIAPTGVVIAIETASGIL